MIISFTTRGMITHDVLFEIQILWFCVIITIVVLFLFISTLTLNRTKTSTIILSRTLKNQMSIHHQLPSSSSSKNTRTTSKTTNTKPATNFSTASISRQQQSVSNLTPEQLQCINRLEDCVDRVLACKRRDMFLSTLQRSIATFTDADKDEPLTPSMFRQHDYYLHFTQELIYFPEKFDFLIHCVLHRICTIHKPAQFHQMLDDLLMPATAALAQRVGGELLSRLIEEDSMREEDEIARVEAFCLKKDWVPRYSLNSPLKKYLKSEQEKKK